MRHLKWTQAFFAERLNGDTFALAAERPRVIKLRRPLAFYQGLDKHEELTYFAGELLDHFKVSRFDCRQTFCCLVMNAKEDWPTGTAGSLNGGINRGSGLLEVSSFALDKLPNFQSTLCHEIAHTVGLPHVNAYGYDMKTNRSVMSYNKMHWTNWFEDSKTPAKLIPEDVRALALADSVFPNSVFDWKQDVPTGYMLFPRVMALGPMTIPGHPDYGPIFTTPSGEDSGSKVGNLNGRFILPNEGPGVTFSVANMWDSARQPDGKIILNMEFPEPVTLTKIVIHSEHSGQYNRAAHVLIETIDGANSERVADSAITSADADIEFAQATGRVWRLTMQAGQSGKICLRGLQFFNSEQPVFPPPVPYDWQEAAAR